MARYKFKFKGTGIHGYAHDAILPEDVLETVAGQDLDLMSRALTSVVSSVSRSLECLQEAHAEMAGLTKGELTDAVMPILANGVESAKVRLKKIQEFEASYTRPSRPHEIRRRAYSRLIAMTQDVIDSISQFLQQFGGGHFGAKLNEELKPCQADLLSLKRRLEELRQQCSQKCQNLGPCINKLNSAMRRIRGLNDFNMAKDREIGLTLHGDFAAWFTGKPEERLVSHSPKCSSPGSVAAQLLPAKMNPAGKENAHEYSNMSPAVALGRRR
jgi:hypothetical protein